MRSFSLCTLVAETRNVVFCQLTFGTALLIPIPQVPLRSWARAGAADRCDIELMTAQQVIEHTPVTGP
jgi:hypothetical protein